MKSHSTLLVGAGLLGLASFLFRDPYPTARPSLGGSDLESTNFSPQPRVPASSLRYRGSRALDYDIIPTG